MTERRSRRRKREDEESEDEENEGNDEQKEIAKYLRFNCETKSSNYQGQKVEYFKGSKAIDCLLDSKWASGKGGTETSFTDRESVRDYLGILLELGMFKRVTRVRKKKKGEKDEGKKSTKDSKESPKPSKNKKDTNEGKNEGSDGKKIKVKVKLELHEYQEFLDGEESFTSSGVFLSILFQTFMPDARNGLWIQAYLNESVYMWIFDPVHPRTIIYGVLVVIGAIVICLFPLWPESMREYTWYLSVGAAVLLGALVVLALLRYVLFGFVWAITAGNHHFWLLPNLTEDLGVLESFVPLYSHSYVGTKEDKEEKTEEADDKESKNETSEDKREPIDENKKDTKDEEDKDRNNEGPVERKQESPVPTTTKEPTLTESWIKVTDEDVAQAKEATGDESDIKTMTSPVTC